MSGKGDICVNSRFWEHFSCRVSLCHPPDLSPFLSLSFFSSPLITYVVRDHPELKGPLHAHQRIPLFLTSTGSAFLSHFYRRPRS